MQFKWITVLSLAVGSLAALEQTDNSNDDTQYVVEYCQRGDAIYPTRESCNLSGGELCNGSCVLSLEAKKSFDFICPQFEGSIVEFRAATSKDIARAAARC